MPNGLPREWYPALKKEIRQWQEDKLLTCEQGALILGRYQPMEKTGRLISILAAIGAVLVGLGVLLFIGANWHKLAAIWKTILVLSAIISCHAAGWYAKFGSGSHPRVGDALILLGCLLYGCGIWLIAQIFHYEADFSFGILLWALGTVPVALITRSALVTVLATVLIAAWTLAEPTGVLPFVVALAVSLFTAYSVKSPWAVAVSLTQGAFWALIRSEAGAFGLALWGVAVFAWYFTHAFSQRWNSLSRGYLYVGSISLMVAFTILTGFGYEHALHLGPQSVARLYVWIMSAIVALIFMSRHQRQVGPELIGLALTVWGVAVLPVLPAGLVFCNLLFLAILFGCLISAVNRLESPGLAAVTLIFLVIDIIARYFDPYFQMLDRSLFFIVGGALLLAVGYIVEPGRRKFFQAQRLQPAEGN